MKTTRTLQKWLKYAAGALALLPVLLPAAAAIKADTTNALNQAESWVGSTPPTAADVATWSGTYSASPSTATGLTNSLKALLPGSTVSWQGIAVGTLSGTALTTNTFYTGTSGTGAETNISTATQTGTLVTITTKANHGYGPGQQVTIAGVTPAGYNGTFTIVGIPSATSFTFNTTAGLTPGTAFGTVESALYVGGSGSATANSALTIGSSGMDLAAASHSLVLNAASLAFSGNQTWTLAAGRNVRLAASGAGAANGKVVTSGTDGLIDISGGGIADANQGGSTGLADAGGFTGFAGKWRVNPGATLRGLRNGATAWGSNPDPDSILLNGGTLAVGGISGAVGSWTWTNGITLAAGTTSAIDNQNVTGTGRYLKLNSVITGSGNLVFKDTLAAGTFTSPDAGFLLTGANTMSGTVTIGGPVENGIPGRLSYVRVGGVGGNSVATGVGADGTLGTALITNNGVLTFGLTGPVTVNSIHGTGSLRVGYATTAGSESQLVTLTGANTYSGNTTINIGTLVIPAGASLPNSSNILITPLTGASFISATLDVSGLTGGLVLNPGQRLVGGPNNAGANNTAQVVGKITAGTGTALVPGGSNVVNTLYITDTLTLTGGATVVADLSNTAGDLLTVGNLTPSGVTTFAITPPVGGLFAGTYPLITCYGTLGGSPANFDYTGLTSSGRGQTYSIIYQDNAVKLRVVGSPGTLTWRGDGIANAWDVSTSTNWLNLGSPDVFYAGDFVTFDDTGSNAPAINLVGTLQAGAITVSALQNYTFSGTGKLTGTGGISNAGPGTLTITTSNDFRGTTIVTGGALAITNESALGANPLTFTADQLTLDAATLSVGAGLTLGHTNRGITLGANGATLAHGAFNVTVSNTVTGSGVLTKTGTGTLTMSGSNTFTGGTVINGGTVVYGHPAGLGRGASTLGTSGFFVKPFTLRDGTVNLNGKAGYDPNFAGGTAAVGVPVTLYDGPITFAGGAGVALSFQDSGGAVTNGWGNGSSSVNTLTYDANENPGTATISARFAASGSSSATTRSFEIGDSTATSVEVDLTGALGVISVNATNQDGRNTTLIKNGLGTLRVSAPNNFPGWQVNAGTLLVNHAQALGIDRTVSIGVSGGTGSTNTLTVSAGVVDLNGFSPVIGGIHDGGSPGGVIRNSGAAASVLTVGLSDTNTVNAAYSGILENGTGGLSLVKDGPGTQVLSGINTYTGSTTLSNGTLTVNGEIHGAAVSIRGGQLAGVGLVGAPVSAQSGGLSAGDGGIGELRLTNSLTLGAGSTTYVDVDATTGRSDLVRDFTSASYAGSLVVTNLSGTVTNGQAFQIFSTGGTGGFTSIGPAPAIGLAWDFNAASGLLTAVAGVATTPTNITATVSGSNLRVSWPAEYTGWQLQVQTNALTVGISNNWVGWTGSTSTNQVDVPIVPANPSVFIRLVYPPQP